jgi:preprotein translocase subunit SecA
MFPVDLAAEDLATEHTDREELVHKLHADAIKLYNEREEELGEELMRAVERFVLLQFIDQRWREHLYDMDYLREGIHLRGFAQIEPIVAYKNEAFTLFEDLMASIWQDFTRMIFNLEVEALEEEEAPEQRYEPSGTSTRPGRVSYSGGGGAEPTALALAAAGGVTEEYVEEEFEAPPPVVQRVLSEEQTVGRNDPCWCGSGKKFKKCHGA